MIRNVKAFGLALMAVCAVGAVAAQGAFAVDHTFQATGKYLTSTNIKHPDGTGPDHVLSAGAAKISCATASFEGEQAAEKADEQTVTPKYSNCKLGENPATVTNEGCAYTFDSDTTSEGESGTKGESGTVKVCNGGGAIKVSAAGCVITFGEQGPLHGIKYSNSGTEPTHVDVTAHVFGIKYTTNKAFACTLAGLPTSGEGSNGTYLGNATTTAYKVREVDLDGEITHKEPVGVHVTTP